MTTSLVYAQNNQNAGTFLAEIESMAGDMMRHAEEAEKAQSIEEVKMHANEVFKIIWGQESELMDPMAKGAIPTHGWKTRWQVDNTLFDDAFVKRNGTLPPEIQDVQMLGMMGRGRAIRHYAQQIIDSEGSTVNQKERAEGLISSLNNVIGWMKMDDGVTKGERQPRVDLTREWDSSTEFWLSTADTGWLAEVYSQAVNILKVDYQDDLEEARQHAKGLVELSSKVIEGVDANSDGVIEAGKMEGGLSAVLGEAREGGFLD